MSDHYAVMWVENADIVGDYESRDVALYKMRDFIREHPWVRGKVAMVPFDSEGHRSGDAIYE